MKFVTFVAFVVICWSFCDNSSGFVTANPPRFHHVLSIEEMMLARYDHLSADFIYWMGETQTADRHVVGESLSRKFAKKPLRFEYGPHRRSNIWDETDTEYIVSNLQVGRNLIAKYNVKIPAMVLNYNYFVNDELTRRLFNNYILECTKLQSFYPVNYETRDLWAFQRFLQKPNPTPPSTPSPSPPPTYLPITQMPPTHLPTTQSPHEFFHKSHELNTEQDTTNVQSDSDFDLEIESDTDSDSMSGVESFLDAHSDIKSDIEFNLDAHSDTKSNVDQDSSTKSGIELDLNTNLNSKLENEVDLEADSDLKSNNHLGLDADSDLKANVNSDANSNSESNFGLLFDPSSDSKLDIEVDLNADLDSKSGMDLDADAESEFELDFKLDSDLSEEKLLAMLAPFSAEEAYIWGENNPEYRKVVGQSLSNDLNKFGTKLVRFGDIPDRKKNIWHETKTECRIYNLQIGRNLITNYNVEITSIFVNYAYFKDETTRYVFNNYIATSETLKEFNYKNANRNDNIFIEWCQARVIEHQNNIISTTAPATSTTTTTAMPTAAMPTPTTTNTTKPTEMNTFTSPDTTYAIPTTDSTSSDMMIDADLMLDEKESIESIQDESTTQSLPITDLPSTTETDGTLSDDQSTESSSEDESELTEEEIWAKLAPFDAEQAYNWGEQHPKYRKIVGKIISTDTNKFGGKRVVFNFKSMPVMAMAESENECEIKDAYVAMNLLQLYDVEIKELEIFFQTMNESQCTEVNRYIEEHKGQFKLLLKHDEILSRIAKLTAEEAFEWAEATGVADYKALVGRSLSKDPNKFANREVIIGDYPDQTIDYFIQTGDTFRISLGNGLKLLIEYKVKFSTVANLIVDCKYMTSQHMSLYKPFILDYLSSNPKLITGPCFFSHIPQGIRNENIQQ